MKTLKNISISHHLILCTIAVCTMFGCRDDGERMDPLSKMQKQLRGVWRVSGVSLSGNDMSIFFHDMTLAFNADKSFACENDVDPIWPPVGTYENIIENDTRFILRDDGIRMTVLSLTSKSLVVEFAWAGAPNGRFASLNGEYVFTFTK